MPHAAGTHSIVRSAMALLLSASCALVSLPSTAGAHDGTVLSGLGSATIDGVVSRDEWDRAACAEFPVNVPEGGTTPGRVCAMNDESNLYLLVQFTRAVVDAGNSAVFEFDNDHSGGPRAIGDDVLLINPVIGFFDEVRTNGPPCSAGTAPGACGFFDTSTGGTNDGVGAFSNDGITTVYEFAHPLDSSDDGHDFSLRSGETVGFTLFIRLLQEGRPIADTFFPTGCISCPDLFGDIVISAPRIPVVIDIKPGDPGNSINPHSRVHVAIMSSDDFDATTVDPSSVRFGPKGAAEDGGKIQFKDVNGDGLDDLILRFLARDTGIRCGDASASLTGSTFTGQLFHGTDSIRTVGCR